MSDSKKEIQDKISLFLAEKRTSLAVLRTAIALFTLPLSVFTILIATSRYYDAFESLHLLIPLAIINIILITFGIHLIYRSFKRIKEIDHYIEKLKKQINML